jgi:hypothetical protein
MQQLRAYARVLVSDGGRHLSAVASLNRVLGAEGAAQIDLVAHCENGKTRPYETEEPASQLVLKTVIVADVRYERYPTLVVFRTPCSSVEPNETWFVDANVLHQQWLTFGHDLHGAD